MFPRHSSIVMEISWRGIPWSPPLLACEFWQFLTDSSSNLPHDGFLLQFCRYYVSLAYIASFFPVAWMFRVAETFDVLCSTAALRSTNVIMAMVCAVLFHDLLLCIRPGIGERKATTYAILVSLYPVHWFFSFLYYTDVASLAAVLAMYLFCLKKKFWISAMVSAWTMFHRIEWESWHLLLKYTLSLHSQHKLIRIHNFVWDFKPFSID